MNQVAFLQICPWFGDPAWPTLDGASCNVLQYDGHDAALACDVREA
jgi:hypothetical protein